MLKMAGQRVIAPENLVPAVHCEVVQAVESYGTINVFVICLDRMGHEQNIIDLGFALQLACAVNHAKHQALDQDIHLVVICSAKKGNFMAGADILTELHFTGDDGSQRAFEDAQKLTQVLCALESLPVPTVAVINGTALGGGLELCLACDYRISSEICSQIGLPEIKIGVLPGVGGCVRLPRLIGMRQALKMLLTGAPVNAYKAQSIGLVDHLMLDTETVLTSSNDQKCSYNYKWLVGLLGLIERRAIGKREFLVGSTRTDLVALDDINVYKEVMHRDVERELMSEVGDLWNEFEHKASIKYPDPSRIDRVLSDVTNTVLYLFSLAQLWKTIGSTFPAPYICLLTAFKCMNASSWKEALTLNSLGFSYLATSAESKSLMALFLLTRKLKKCAVYFQLEETDKSAKFEKDVIVLVSSLGLGYSAVFVQGLLYAGFEVRVIDVSESLAKPRIEELVRKHFQYSINRGHLTEEAVQERISQLLFNHGSDVSMMEFDGEDPLRVVDCSFGDKRGKMVLTDIKQQAHEVVCMSVAPQSVKDSGAVHVNLGDPLRKNTLCVEITPATHEVRVAHVRQVASLIVGTGKIPVLTPPTQSQASHLLTLTHWALAVTMVGRCRLRRNKLDSILCKRGGYTKGPFSTMAGLDAEFVRMMINCSQLSTVPHLDQLENYITTKKVPRVRYRSHPSPSRTELVELFNLYLSLTALQVKESTTDISEAAIDVLSVSGLVNFPPGEGGPLNYLARLGLQAVRRKWTRLSKFLSPEMTEGISELLVGEVFDRLFSKTESAASQLTGYGRMREQTVLLSGSDLLSVGRTGMVSRRNVFTYPLPTVVAVLLVSLLVYIAFCVFLYYLL